jgi:NAD(P)-dependent dehydrogenase (short-subunit alcohol dehydrogenase family)
MALFSRSSRSLRDRRVLVTGAARGIGAALARRLTERGARVAVLGLERAELAKVAEECGGAPWAECDVSDREQVDASVTSVIRELGGLDVVVANAGIAAQLPLIGGNPEVFERHLSVNVLGVYYTLRAAGPHVSHADGYALTISSLAAALHPPLLGAYSASKAAVEAMSNSLRIELAASGARVGVGYFAELDTDMTRRGFGTEAAAKIRKAGPFTSVAPLSIGIDALERGITRRARRIVAPWWVDAVLPFRMPAQRVVEVLMRKGVDEALRIARAENAPLTTAQPVAAGQPLAPKVTKAR